MYITCVSDIQGVRRRYQSLRAGITSGYKLTVSWFSARATSAPSSSNFIFKTYFMHIMFVCLPIYAPHSCLVLVEVKGGIRSPEIRFISYRHTM